VTTAIILAAGIGSRLRPHTDDRPKCLIDINGRTLLERTLGAIIDSGIPHCAIVTGYLQEQIEAHLDAFRNLLSIRTVLNESYDRTQNNHSLWLGMQQTQGSDLLILDADILFDPALLPRLLDAPHPNALLVRTDKSLGQEEIKVMVDGGVVTQIGKHVPPDLAAGESIGIEKFRADGAARLFDILCRRHTTFEYYEASFQELIESGASVAAVGTLGLPCMEIDSPEDLVAARRLALDREL
jgi:choline kinase